MADMPDFSSLADVFQRLTQATEASTAAAELRAEADKAASEAAKKEAKATADENKTKAESKAALQKIIDTGKAVASEFMSIADAGAKLSTSLGVSLTRGVQLELKNRTALIGQLFRVETDRIATMQQIQSAEKSLVDVLGGTRVGMELSAQGAADFTNRLKTAAGGDFTLTAGAMQAMITAGIGTADGLEQARKATGLRNLSEQRFTQLVNKNSLSFMLYGPRFAKAAQQAEKLGISLAAVQSAQESMVTNLDGTIDTVAQINQLGGQIDFGTLTTLNETQGPEATLKYLQSTIPPSLFQSASTRALLKGFGISVEDLMKGQQSVQKSAADKIEEQLTRMEEPVGTIANAMAFLQKTVELLRESFGPLIKAVAMFGIALFGLSKISMATVTNMFPFLAKLGGGAPKMLGPMTLGATQMASFMKVGPLAALFSSIGGFVSAKKEGADTKTALATGSVRGVSTLIGAGIGAALIPILGPLGPFIGAMLGDFFSRFIPKSIINTVASLFGDIAKVFMGWVDSIKEVFGAVKNLFAAIMSENSKLRPLLNAIGFVLGGVVGGIVTIVGGFVNIILRLATALAKGGAFVINALAKFIGGEATPTTTGNDVVSRSGYGDRTLVTPNGSVALNNRDNVVAFADDMISGVRTMSLGTISKGMQAAEDDEFSKRISNFTSNLRTLSMGNANNTTMVTGNNDLTRKIDELITVLGNAKTVINIDNKVQEVPRNSVVGVYSRNERRT